MYRHGSNLYHSPPLVEFKQVDVAFRFQVWELLLVAVLMVDEDDDGGCVVLVMVMSSRCEDDVCQKLGLCGQGES